MTSKYAIALYELICLRANREQCVEVLQLEEFRELLGVPPGAYERGLTFPRKSGHRIMRILPLPVRG